MSNSYAGTPLPGASGASDDLVDLEPVVPVTTDTSTDDGSSSASGAQAKAGAAKEQAGQVASGAADAGKHVAGVAKEQAGNVAAEAKTQIKDLYHQTRGQVSEQAGTQQQKAAAGIRQISEHFSSMSENADSGVAQNLVSEAATRLQGVATWLDDRDPGSLLDEVKQFAARRPGTFIGIAAIAGVVAGRLTRSVVGAVSDEKEADAAASEPVGTSSFTTPSYTATAGDLTGTVDPEYGVNEYGTGLGGTSVGDVRP